MSEEKENQELQDVPDFKEDEGSKYSLPWGWLIAAGVFVILMAVCLIVILNL